MYFSYILVVCYSKYCTSEGERMAKHLIACKVINTLANKNKKWLIQIKTKSTLFLGEERIRSSLPSYKRKNIRIKNG